MSNESMTDDPEPKLSPFCTSLSSKKVIMNAAPPLTSADVLDSSGAVWCKETSQILGPDGEVCDPDFCRAGRSCFRSPFEDLL